MHIFLTLNNYVATYYVGSLRALDAQQLKLTRQRSGSERTTTGWFVDAAEWMSNIDESEDNGFDVRVVLLD